MNPKTTTTSPLLAQLIKWFTLIALVPILLVGLHYWAMQRYPDNAKDLGLIAFPLLAGYEFLIMYSLRSTLEKQLYVMLAPRDGEEGGSSLLAVRVLAWSVVVVLTIITALLLVDYYGHNRGAFSGVQSTEGASESGSLGTFGDFFGGVVNPLLTFGTLVALAITMLMQRTQLTLAEQSTRKTLEQMHKQGFETTFFNLLTLHNQTVQELQLDPSEISIPVWRDDPEKMTWNVDTEERFDSDGKPVYFDYRDMYSMTYQSTMKGIVKGRAVFGMVLDLMSHHRHYNLGATPLGMYSHIQIRHNYVLGHYFRTLFQLLELVDEYAKDTDVKSAKKYSSILRAQLSASELILLFYNCAYSLVDQGEFRNLLVRYAMLEHMPLQVLPLFSCLRTPNYHFELGLHARQYFGYSDGRDLENAGAFGTNPQACEYVALLKQRAAQREAA